MFDFAFRIFVLFKNVVEIPALDCFVQDIMKWLPKSEERLYKMAPPAAEIRPVRIQLEELKVRLLIDI